MAATPDHTAPPYTLGYSAEEQPVSTNTNQPGPFDPPQRSFAGPFGYTSSPLNQLAPAPTLEERQRCLPIPASFEEGHGFTPMTWPELPNNIMFSLPQELPTSANANRAGLSPRHGLVFSPIEEEEPAPQYASGPPPFEPGQQDFEGTQNPPVPAPPPFEEAEYAFASMMIERGAPQEDIPWPWLVEPDELPDAPPAERGELNDFDDGSFDDFLSPGPP